MRSIGRIKALTVRTAIITITIVLCVLNYSTVSANSTYQSYYYSRAGKSIEIEAPFVCESVIVDYGGEKLKSPSDIFVHGEYIFIVDTGNNRILKLDSNFNIVLEIKEFIANGTEDALNAPEGIFIADDGQIYVADTNNKRIVVFDSNGSYVRQITPKGQEFENGQQPFSPTSLVIEKTGRLLINSKQVYKGIIALNPTGEFIGYFGANRARVNPLEYFWKAIATREQRAGMILDIPTEIAKIHLDKEGFPYVITNTYSKVLSPREIEAELPVRRLNLTGENILNYSDSEYYPIGDIEYFIDSKNKRGASNIVDICTTDLGIYFLLDSSKGRIFAYNQTGRNIFTFGTLSGLQYGTVRSPAALDMYKDSLLVLDRYYGSISIFRPTQFGSLILNALQMHYDGEYEEAKKLWEKVIDGYGYYDLAYLGIGKVLIYERKYEEAMEYFRIARDKNYYSMAFKEVRKNTVERYFALIVLIAAALILFMVYGVRFIKKKLEDRFENNVVYEEIKHVMYTTIHPFKGFYEFKIDNKGSYTISIILFLLMAIVMFMRKTATSFLFRVDTANVESLLKNMGSVLLVVLLWMVVLYLMEIFLEGEAKFSHIVFSTSTALVPAIIAHVIAIICTYGASLDDSAMINAIITCGWVWTAYLIFTGVLVTNDYTMTRTLIASFVNILGMAIVFAISVLLISLIQDMLIFISFALREIRGVFRL